MRISDWSSDVCSSDLGLLIEEGRAPEPLIFALPRHDVTIIDNWHIMGMQGTASCDIEVDSAFVPDRRSAPFLPALAGQSAGHALHANPTRSEEHTSELQSLMRSSYAVFCLKKKNNT